MEGLRGIGRGEKAAAEGRPGGLVVIIGSTFDHAQAGAQDGNEGDGFWEDLVGLKLETQLGSVLW